MIRRALATIAVSAVAVVGLAPAASAQFIPGANDFIANADCGLVEQSLKGLGLVDEDTTRNQLAAKVRAETGKIIDHPLINITASNYAGQIADRALECGIVKEDPQNPFSGSAEFLDIFSGLSSN